MKKFFKFNKCHYLFIIICFISNDFLKNISDINGVLVLADRLSHELLHFAREFHYYILFEVVECLWEKFSMSFSKAKSFDDVIKAHDDFINEMQAKTFQDEESRVCSLLSLIYNPVIFSCFSLNFLVS